MLSPDDLPTDFNDKDATWVLGHFLGKDNHAIVHELISTTDNTETRCAGKFIEKPVKGKTKDTLIREIAIMKDCKHPNVCEMFSVTEIDTHYVIRMELCRNKTMDNLITIRKSITESEAKYYLVQLLRALEYLHANNIIHRDVKSANMYLDIHSHMPDIEQIRLKLGDFGLACKLSDPDEMKSDKVGTPNCVAPEILSCTEFGHRENLYDVGGNNGLEIEKLFGYSFPVDLWSTGVSLYFWIVGEYPFGMESINKTYRNILNCNWRFPYNFDDVPISAEKKEIRDVIKVLLQKEPENRPSATFLLKHDSCLSAENIVSSMSVDTLSSKPKPKLDPIDTDIDVKINNNDNDNTASDN